MFVVRGHGFLRLLNLLLRLAFLHRGEILAVVGSVPGRAMVLASFSGDAS